MNPKNKLLKYYVGIGVLVIFTLGLAIFVSSQGSQQKKDKQVNAAAIQIAEDLNEYIEEKQKIPDALSDVSNVNIPEEVTYTKKQDSYEFCVSYNSDSSSGLSADSIVSQGLSGSYGGVGRYEYESRYKPSTLYVSSYSWSEGEKCYEVEPIIYDNRYFFNDDDSYLNDYDYNYDDIRLESAN